ncbi:MAG: hypothetical protein R2787_10855 [Saprospiraceae bacterium]
MNTINHSLIFRLILTIFLILLLIAGIAYGISQSVNTRDNAINDATLIGYLGSIIGLIITISKYWSDQDKMQLELIILFNNKYDLLNDKLFDIINKVNNLESTCKDSDPRKTFQDYLNLCAEEYFWYKRARLSKQIFKSWECGMIININKICKIQEMKFFIKEEMKNDISYFKLFAYLKLNENFDKELLEA